METVTPGRQAAEHHTTFLVCFTCEVVICIISATVRPDNVGPGSGSKGRWQILNQVRRRWDLATLKRAVNRGEGHRIIRCHADETLELEHRMSAGKKQTLQFGKVFDKTQRRRHQQMCEHRRGKNSYILILWQTRCQTRAVRFCASPVL